MNWTFDDKYGYFLDVDLRVGSEIHDKLKEFPPAAESREITYDDFSETNKIIHQEIFGVGKTTYKSRKLVATLEDKVRKKEQRCICHGQKMARFRC